MTTLLGVRLLEHAADRDVDLIGIAEEALAVCGRELERPRIPMDELERTSTQRRDVVTLEEIPRHRHERTLRPRPAGVPVDAAICAVRGSVDAHVILHEILF